MLKKFLKFTLLLLRQVPKTWIKVSSAPGNTFNDFWMLLLQLIAFSELGGLQSALSRDLNWQYSHFIESLLKLTFGPATEIFYIFNPPLLFANSTSIIN